MNIYVSRGVLNLPSAPRRASSSPSVGIAPSGGGSAVAHRPYSVVAAPLEVDLLGVARLRANLRSRIAWLREALNDPKLHAGIDRARIPAEIARLTIQLEGL
jgi:hypothetical protein